MKDLTPMPEIRESLNHELVPGRSYFKDKIEEITNRQTRLGIPGRPMIEEDGAIYVVYWNIRKNGSLTHVFMFFHFIANNTIFGMASLMLISSASMKICILKNYIE